MPMDPSECIPGPPPAPSHGAERSGAERRAMPPHAAHGGGNPRIFMKMHDFIKCITAGLPYSSFLTNDRPGALPPAVGVECCSHFPPQHSPALTTSARAAARGNESSARQPSSTSDSPALTTSALAAARGNESGARQRQFHGDAIRLKSKVTLV